jgi:glycosyltransferase involved in cell wall biosynthesis
MGGAEVLAARLARRLGDGNRCVFLCLDEIGSLGQELQGDGFTVEVLQRRPGIDWRGVWRLARFFRRERVDILHAHQYGPFFYSLMARRLYRQPPILFTEHGRHFPDYPRQKRIWANRLLLEKRDRVVAVGEAVRHALIANEGISAARIALIYNGVDLSPYRKSGTDRDAVRKELGLQPVDFALIQVARLDYLKDHVTAVKTLERVTRRQPNTHLILIGTGEEESKIRQAIADRRLESSVKLLGLRTDVPRLLTAADCFLLTSISEGIPLTIIEAMAAGLPVVATRVGGMSEVVVDGTTGLLSPAGADESLAEHILSLASDPELRRRLAQAGKERAFKFFSEDRMNAAYQRLYQELVSG